MKRLVFLSAALALVLLPGCAGYQFGADKPTKLAKVTKLAVPTFKNNTLVPRIEVLVTNALIKRLQTQGVYKIVPREEADAVLKAEIFDIQRSQFRSELDNTLRTAEILMRLRVNFTVEDANGMKLLNGQQVGASEAVLDTNFQLTQTQVLADAAERFAFQMASQLTEGW